jgi:hypothetical protein
MDPEVTRYNRGSQCVTVGDMVNPLFAFTQLAGEVREARACASKVNPVFEKTTAQKPWYLWNCYAGMSNSKKKRKSSRPLYLRFEREPMDSELDASSERSGEQARRAA